MLRLSVILGAALIAGCSGTKNLGYDPNQVYPVRVSGAYGFINSTGKLVVEPVYDSISWYNFFPMGVEKEKKWGYVDKYGAEVFEPQFQLIHPFVNGRAWFRHSLGHGLLAEDGRKLTEAFFHFTPEFKNGRAPNLQGSEGKCIVMDTSGAVKESTFCFHDHDGYIGVYKAGGKFGFATLDGRLVIKPKYAFAETFSGGLAAVAADSSLYGYVDTLDQWVIQPKFKIARTFEHGVARVLALNDQWGLIDRSGRFVTPPKYRTIQEFNGGLARVSAFISGRELWGLIDTTGKVVAEPQYYHLGNFDDGLAPANLGGLYGYIDGSGKMVIQPRFRIAHVFSNGRAAFTNNGRTMGFIDTKGEVVVPDTFTDVRAYVNGLAMVTTGGRIPDYFSKSEGVTLMYIDRSGRVLWRSED